MAVCFKRFSTVAALLVLAAALAATAGARRADTVLPTLYVNYTMNCTFTITGDNGSRVSSIPPGTYQVFITTPMVFADVDLTGVFDMTACKSFAQFQLTGSGVNISTTLQDGDEDKDTYRATFQPSATYTAVDLNQPSVARVVFSTTATGAPTAPTSPTNNSTSGKGSVSTDIVGSNADGKSSSGSTALRGTIVATIAPTGNPKVTFGGKIISKLKSGRYTISVVDNSKKGGLIIQEIHRLAQTVSGAAFTGRKSVSIDLKAGQWFFYQSFIGNKTYFIVTN